MVERCLRCGSTDINRSVQECLICKACYEKFLREKGPLEPPRDWREPMNPHFSELAMRSKFNHQPGDALRFSPYLSEDATNVYSHARYIDGGSV